MKAIMGVAAAALAVAPTLTNAATAAPLRSGSWAFTDYTADPTSLAADDAFHVVTGTVITSYCHGSRVPSAPQDVNARSLSVRTTSTLKLVLHATGVWGIDVTTQRGSAVTGTASQPSTTTQPATATAPTELAVRLRPGTYKVVSCNLGGAPTASVSYELTPVRR